MINGLARESRLKMMGKCRRAYRRVGRESTEEEQRDLLARLLLAKIPVLNRGSKRIAWVITGEVSMESLQSIRSGKKST